MADAIDDALAQLPASAGPVAPCGRGPAAPDCAALADASDKAMLSDFVYGKNTALPPGYRYLDPKTTGGQAELAQLGVAPNDLQPKDSDFAAGVFVKAGAGDPAYVVAFRGTQSLQDWGNNLQQGVGLPSDEYQRAKALATTLDQTTGGQVSFTGHSLGGGLASAAAVITDQPAVTFNAAGLNANTVGGYPAAPPPVDAYFVPGEMLSALQDNRVAVLSGLAGGASLLSPALGGALSGFLLAAEASASPLLPPAFGSRHALPVSPPDGKTLVQRNNPIDKHGMDWVQNGIKAKQKELGCP